MDVAPVGKQWRQSQVNFQTLQVSQICELTKRKWNLYVSVVMGDHVTWKNNDSSFYILMPENQRTLSLISVFCH